MISKCTRRGSGCDFCPGLTTEAVVSPVIPSLRLTDPAGLDPCAVLAVARGELVLELADDLIGRLDGQHARMLAALDAGDPVYGVTTGMGALSEVGLDQAARARHSEALLTARAAGGPPWLSPAETRAVLAVRLRTFLNGDAAVSAKLCGRLAESIARGVLPAIPRRSTGAAGEIVGLAHLGAALTGAGDVLAPGPGAGTRPAGQALAEAGLLPLRLGPKEGVALIEGVPMTTALAVLAAGGAREVLRHALTVLAAEFAITGAARDVLDARLARGDDALARVTGRLRDLAGPVSRPHALQPPVSFRASPQVLAHLSRAIDALDAATGRALGGVTDSPAFLDGQFVGSAGFYGYDLAVHLHALTVALIGVAELGTARLHRLMNPAVTGLNAQLSAEPGRRPASRRCTSGPPAWRMSFAVKPSRRSSARLRRRAGRKTPRRSRLKRLRPAGSHWMASPKCSPANSSRCTRPAASPSATRTRSGPPPDCGPHWMPSQKACPPVPPTARSAGTWKRCGTGSVPGSGTVAPDKGAGRAGGEPLIVR
jgi:histidine ammonia-lyase